MTKTNPKLATIKEIVKSTYSNGTEVFDYLNDQTESYLTKLLKIIKKL